MPSPICSQKLPARALGDLRPLVIGKLPIGFPVVQAALSGYSDGPMRIIARRCGVSYTLAEVMIDRLLIDQKQGRRFRQHLSITDEEHPVGGQLMGAEPVDFASAACLLVDAGFDVIDINFGCPVKTAVGGCRGGYHLGQPETALEIIRRVRDVVPDQIPVTLKMRRGLDDTHQSRDRFFQILDGAFESGIAAITVHGRTVAQKYVGPSNWDFLSDVKRHAGDRTILGSGDLFSAQACLEMIRDTGVDGVSVARGAIGNPWIFSQTRAIAAGLPIPIPDLSEQRRVMELHLQLCLNTASENQALSTMRMFAVKYARLHPQHEDVRNDFAKIRGLDGWNLVLDRWYP